MILQRFQNDHADGAVFRSFSALNDVLSTIQRFLRQNRDIEPSARILFFRCSGHPGFVYLVHITIAAQEAIVASHLLVLPLCCHHCH